MEVIIARAESPDTEELFVNTVEAGARMLLEAADAVRDAGKMPDKERIRAFLGAVARTHGYCSNTKRVLEDLIMTISNVAATFDINDVEMPDVDELSTKDKALLSQRRTLFTPEDEPQGGSTHE